MGMVQEAVARIRKVGVENARITPISGSKKVKIEIKNGGGWATVLKDLDQNIAEDVLQQAKNRLIFG